MANSLLLHCMYLIEVKWINVRVIAWYWWERVPACVLYMWMRILLRYLRTVLDLHCRENYLHVLTQVCACMYVCVWVFYAQCQMFSKRKKNHSYFPFKKSCFSCSFYWTSDISCYWNFNFLWFVWLFGYSLFTDNFGPAFWVWRGWIFSLTSFR